MVPPRKSIDSLACPGPEDLELKLEVSEAPARKLWSSLNAHDLVSFDVPEKAVSHLKRATRTRR